MFLLKVQWALFDLKAPAFSWLVSGAIIMYCMCVYLRHLRESRHQTHAISVAEKQLTALRDSNAMNPGNAISRKLYDSIAAVFTGLPFLQPTWQRISSSIVSRPDKNGQMMFWAGEDVAGAFNEAITDSHAYKTAPAVITGVGLLATFVAILVALLDVKLANNRVQGLDLLVQGLSGKFLSSIVALGCATLLIYAEKWILYPVRARIASLASILTGLLPRLLPAQLLSDLCTEMAEQSHAFKTFNAELPSRLKQSIAEGAGQSLDRIATILGELDHSIKQNALHRYEAGNAINAINEQPAHPLKHPEHSGSAANPASAQSAHTAESVTDGTALLELMAKQFSRNQDALKELIGVVKELSGRVAVTLEKTTESSNKNVKEALREAGSLGTQNIHRLAELIQARGANPVDAEEIRMSLAAIAQDLSVAVAGQGRTTEALQKVATEVNAGVMSLSQIAKSIRETQELAVRASSSASGQIESLNDFIRGQQLVWGRIQASMVQYENVFGKVEGHAKDLLTQIAQHLSGYSDTTEKHFVQLTSAADTFISQATGRLSGSIDELSEQLDELQSAVAGITRISRAVA